MHLFQGMNFEVISKIWPILKTVKCEDKKVSQVHVYECTKDKHIL